MKKPDNYKENSRKRIMELIEEYAGDEPDRKQQAFADMCGVSKASISQYVSGANTPGNVTAAKIASKCNVNPLWVMGFDVRRTSDADAFAAYADEFNRVNGFTSDREDDLLVGYRKLSTVDKKFVEDLVKRLADSTEKTSMKRYVYFHHIAAAGNGFLFEDIPTTTIEAPVMGNADFIIGVSGDSMEPTFSDGDDVYVKRTNELTKGDVGIFTYNNECFIKELGDDGLVSHNPKYSTIPGSSDIRCVGKVLGKVRR